MFIGACQNGDLIAIDMLDAEKSIWYLDHENMEFRVQREFGIRVAATVEEVVEGLAEGTLPCDYYHATGDDF